MSLATLKAKIVTSGTVIACCLLVFFPIRAVVYNRPYMVITSFILVLICLGIIKGIRLAYASARFIYAVVAILFSCNSVNGFFYEDAMIGESWNDATFYRIFGKLVSIGIVCITLFWCLGEHAKLRGVKGYKK